MIRIFSYDPLTSFHVAHTERILKISREVENDSFPPLRLELGPALHATMTTLHPGVSATAKHATNAALVRRRNSIPQRRRRQTPKNPIKKTSLSDKKRGKNLQVPSLRTCQPCHGRSRLDLSVLSITNCLESGMRKLPRLSVPRKKKGPSSYLPGMLGKKKKKCHEQWRRIT